MMSVFYNLARGKLKEVDRSNDLPIVPGSQVTDLAWENDRFTRNVIGTSLNDDQSNASMFHVNDSGNPTNSKNKNLEALNYFQALLPSNEVETTLINDTTPGPRYPVYDFLHDSNLLPEIAPQDLSLTNNFPSIHKINSLDLATSSANSISSDIEASSGLRSGQLQLLWFRSGNTDIARPQAFVEGVFPSTRVDKKDPGIANPSSFSSFFRANIANENSVPNFGTLVNNPSDKRKGSCATEEKGIIVPTNTSSSVCSTVKELCGNPAQSLKRKCLESDDHEGMTEDLEDESTGAGNATLAKGRTSSKRGRIAEVHNLSERRRRDRINERMHALQELIPNCDKVDKATLLDEAIEYMKTLQRQVQLMSMGAGLYVPPMTLPPHMQHIQATYMPHFYSTGQEMGCGLAVNPMARVPIMEVANFPGPSLRPVPERTSFRPMAGTSFSSFRHPSQSVPFLASCINADTMTVEIPCYIGQSNSDDSVKNDNLPLMGNIEDYGADKQKTIQLQSKKEELFKASNLVLTNNRPSDGRTNNRPSDGRSVDNVDLAK